MPADTVSTIVGPDGAPARLPTTLLTQAEADLVRQYFRTILSAGYEPEYRCCRCSTADGPDEAHFRLSDQRIFFSCACRALVFSGDSPYEPAILFPEPVTIEPGALATLPLSNRAAALFHAWKTFLRTRHLIEALRCNRCWEAGRPDGLSASVTAHAIHLRCRCTLRTWSTSPV